MKKEENIDLQKLVEEASINFVEEKKKGITGLIKGFFQKCEQLKKDIEKLKIEENKKQKSLDDTLEKINELKKGNWSILQEIKENKEEQKFDEKEGN